METTDYYRHEAMYSAPVVTTLPFSAMNKDAVNNTNQPQVRSYESLLSYFHTCLFSNRVDM